MISKELAKWLQTIKIGWSNQLAYKLNFVLLVIGPTLVFFFIKYNLWTAIYQLQDVDTIQGYNLSQMLSYQVWVMIVGFLAQSYNSMNLAEDIRLGRISSYLIYPFGFWSFHTANFFATQLIQFIVAAITLAFSAVFFDFVSLPTLTSLLSGLLIALLVGLLWFQISFIIGLVAFWLEETWVLRVIFTTITQFFSGAIIPLELYPDWLRDWLFYSPFPYLTFVPVRFFLGDQSFGLAPTIAIIGFWIAVTLALGRFIWSRGLKLYTAAGM